MKNLVILTGAGISAESGVPTFRDSDGLWCNYRVEDVCTPEALQKNPNLVIKFYNDRRKQLDEVFPNKAHTELVKLESKYNVNLITQNVDDLHERAGSHNILHLHGELRKLRCTMNPEHIFPISGWEEKDDEKCSIDNAPLRPHIVFFGEGVPNIEPAVELTQKADIFIVIGTSLQVYPAASLLYYTKPECKKYLIDPKAESSYSISNLTIIREKATTGVPQVVEELMK